jgi:hypothetical protein
MLSGISMSDDPAVNKSATQPLIKFEDSLEVDLNRRICSWLESTRKNKVYLFRDWP